MKRFWVAVFGFLALTAAVSADARSNMTIVVAGLESVGFEWEPWGNEMCARDDLCTILAGKIQIQAIGRNVDLMPTSQEPTDVYLLACSAVLAALTGRGIESAMKSVAAGFEQATGGQSRQDFGAFRLTMKAPAGSHLECGFLTP